MIGVWTNLNPFNVGYTGADQLQNAREMYGYFDAKGWTLESISGMLGNMKNALTAGVVAGAGELANMLMEE